MRNTEREWSDMKKGFGQPVFAIGVNHFRGVLDDEEGERDQVLLKQIWVWVLDDGEVVWSWGVFWTTGKWNREGLGEREK